MWKQQWGGALAAGMVSEGQESEVRAMFDRRFGSRGYRLRPIRDTYFCVWLFYRGDPTDVLSPLCLAARCQFRRSRPDSVAYRPSVVGELRRAHAPLLVDIPAQPAHGGCHHDDHRRHPELAHRQRESHQQHQDGVTPSGGICLRMDRFRPKCL